MVAVYCRSCKERHEPPTGTQCAVRLAKLGIEINPPQPPNTQEKMMSLLLSMKGDFNDVKTRLALLEENQKAGSLPSDGDGSDSEVDPKENGGKENVPPPKKEDKPPQNFNTSVPQVPRGKKSGRDKTAIDVVFKDVDWPHFYVQTRQHRPATYDTLTVEEFVYGYLRVISNEQDEAVKAAMRSHLEELMLDARQYSWPKARSFHALILAEMERGNLTWLDREGIQYIRHRKGYVASPARNSGPALVPSTSGVTICKAYNEGSCSIKNTHGGQKHVCSFCFSEVQRMYRHPETQCNRKKDSEGSTSDTVETIYEQ